MERRIQNQSNIQDGVFCENLVKGAKPLSQKKPS